MRKIFSVLLSLILILYIYNLFYYPQKVLAENCTVQFDDPSKAYAGAKEIDFTIQTDLVVGKKYWIKFENKKFIQDKWGAGNKDYIINGDKKIKIEKLNGSGTYAEWFPEDFKSKIYRLDIIDPDSNAIVCTTSFTIKPPTTTNNGCSIQFRDIPFTPEKDIQIVVDGLDGSKPNDEHRVVLKRNNERGQEVSQQCFKSSDLWQWDHGVSLGKREVGNYYVEVRDGCQAAAGIRESRICSLTGFPILKSGSTGEQGLYNESTMRNNNRIDKCSPVNNNDLYFVCNTAIGPISTNPTEFIKRIFSFILGIAGGIALLLIIFSGYKFMTSQGNPEKIQGARETMTSAIVGLLFIIFSMLILQLIGVDILKIPGFG